MQSYGTLPLNLQFQDLEVNLNKEFFYFFFRISSFFFAQLAIEHTLAKYVCYILILARLFYFVTCEKYCFSLSHYKTHGTDYSSVLQCL